MHASLVRRHTDFVYLTICLLHLTNIYELSVVGSALGSGAREPDIHTEASRASPQLQSERGQRSPDKDHGQGWVDWPGPSSRLGHVPHQDHPAHCEGQFPNLSKEKEVLAGTVKTGRVKPSGIIAESLLFMLMVTGHWQVRCIFQVWK